MSNREKKRIVSEGLRKLQNDPNWRPTPKTHQDRLAELRRSDDVARIDRVENEGDACVACAAARAELGDETALCEGHLAEAMGL